MVYTKEVQDSIILQAVSGSEHYTHNGFNIHDDYLAREARENAVEAGELDLEDTPGVPELEYRTNLQDWYMRELEQERCPLDNEVLRIKQYNQEQKEANMAKQQLTFVDWKVTKELKIAGLSVKNHPKFENKMCVKSTLSVVLADGRKLVIGAKNDRVWVGIDVNDTVEATVLEM